MSATPGTAEFRIYYPILDALRFASALAVVLLHLGFMVWLNPNPARAQVAALPGTAPPAALFWWGGMGVEVFFLISGFVIAASANGASPFSFLRSRVERLYPGVWICAALTGAVLLALAIYPAGLTLRLFARSALLVPVGPWIDGQYWTLRAEVGFYATILLLLWTGGTRMFQQLACLLVLLSLPSLAGESLDGLGIIARNPFAFVGTGVAQLVPVHFGTYFGLGMLLWLRHERLLRRWAVPFVPLAIAVGGLAAIAHAAGSARNFADRVPLVAATWWIPLAVWLSACALIALGRPLRLPRDRPLRRELRALRALGLATYPLYLVHLTPGLWLMGVLLRGGAAPLSALLLTMAAVVPLSLLIALAGEPPLRALLRRGSTALAARGLVPARALRRTVPIGTRLVPVAPPSAAPPTASG